MVRGIGRSIAKQNLDGSIGCLVFMATLCKSKFGGSLGGLRSPWTTTFPGAIGSGGRRRSAFRKGRRVASYLARPGIARGRSPLPERNAVDDHWPRRRPARPFEGEPGDRPDSRHGRDLLRTPAQLSSRRTRGQVLPKRQRRTQVSANLDARRSNQSRSRGHPSTLKLGKLSLRLSRQSRTRLRLPERLRRRPRFPE